jgi:hypothetical protein
MIFRNQARHQVRYAISDPQVFELCDQVCGTVTHQLRDLDAILHAT